MNNIDTKKFNFVLLEFNAQTANWAPQINAYAVEDFNCDGIEEFSLEESRVDEILGERAYSGGDVPESLIDEVQEATTNQETFTYKYFFYQENFEENAADFVFFIKENYSEIPLFTAQKNFEDWNAEWKKFYAPIWISPQLEIIPEWLKEGRVKKSKHQIYIYPGMGFGTGTHETTFLCLRLYDQISEKIQENTRCLDFGCGSGILGIAAIRSKKMKTHFCDIDKSALDNCVQNLILNFDGEDITGTELFLRDRHMSKKYDVVFANILENVLILEKNLLLESLDKDAFLIVSGLLNHQVDKIINEYKELDKIDVVSKGDWSAILFRKKG